MISTMIEFIMGLHNLLRWVVVFAGLIAIFTALRGLLTRAAWTQADRRAGLVFTTALQLQLLLGIILYVISPLVQGALSNFGAAMESDVLRRFALEHPLLMLLATLAAQLGYSLSRRASTDRAKFGRASVGYLLAAALIVVGTPWGRSLIPWG